MRPPRLRDVDAIFKNYASDREVTEFLPWRPARFQEETAAQVRLFVAMWRRGKRFPWVITEPDSKLIVGMIEIRLVTHAAEVGFVLARSRWGKGYMTEALGAVIDTALGVPQVFRVWAVCDVENNASRRVLEKAGMSREGVLHRYALHPNLSGEPRDVYCYAVTR